METRKGMQDSVEGEGAIDPGRRQAMRQIAVGVGALAGLSVLPEQWTQPIIGRIVIPAHAQTSGQHQQSQRCGLVAGCYQVLAPALLSGDHFNWPGGSGPYLGTVPYGPSPGCTNSNSLVYMVLASSRAEAEVLLGRSNLEELTVAEAPAGCAFYVYIT